MARAVATCTCERCGKQFEKIARSLPNRAAADRYEDWAQGNYTLCEDCYREYRRETRAGKAAPLLAELGLPPITGQSEKQIRYAEDLRNKALTEHPDEMRELGSWYRRAKAGELDERSKELGQTPEEIIHDCLEGSAWPVKWCVIFESCEARRIIDALRD